MNTLPAGFTVRPPNMDDLAPVFDIIIASDTVLYGAPEPGYTLRDLRHDWQSPGHNLETDSWVVLSPEGSIVAANGVWHGLVISFLWRIRSSRHKEGRLGS
jgi:hypothetical protein